MASGSGPRRAWEASGAMAGTALQLGAALSPFWSRLGGPEGAPCSFAGGARVSSTFTGGGARLQGASAAGRKAS
eukprot:612932-Heterocapsa_arctica.AAC.1